MGDVALAFYALGAGINGLANGVFGHSGGNCYYADHKARCLQLRFWTRFLAGVATGAAIVLG